jgi:predicted P-loop ATPase
MARAKTPAIAPEESNLNSFNYSLQPPEPGSEIKNGCGNNGGFYDGKSTCSPEPGPNLAGSALTPADFAALAARWINRPVAERALLRRVDSSGGAELVGRKGGNYAGLAIPYFAPDSWTVREYRVRRDRPEMEADSSGQLKPKQKYLSPPGRGNMLYLVPGIAKDVLSDTALPIILTEGEFKTLALWRLAIWESEHRPRFLPVGISGVFNWRGTIGKTSGPDGERLDVKGPIPDLDRIAWEGRRVIVAFDADASSKEQVRYARAELARHLRGRGAHVGFLEWSAGQGKGIDDHLASVGPECVLDAIGRVNCSSFDWRKELLRARPTTTHPGGLVFPVLANAIAALRHAPEWQRVLAFNEFELAPMALRPAPWGPVFKGIWTDHEDRLTAEWLQRKSILVDVGIAAQAVQTASKDRAFHPVRKYLEGIEWDGVARLDQWLPTYLGVEKSGYAAAVGARWLISAVARIYRPGVKADCCLILEGPQGSKKSTALKTLAGPYFTDELADLGSKDAALQTRGVWIIELSELDTLSRSDVSRIKAFMSRTTDRFRPPYGKRLIESPRQCVFAGSVNHSHYLRDDTGGRRFWPVACGVIDIHSLSRDRDQLWAEARARFDDGSPWWLETEELVGAAATQQADRYDGDPWEELVARWSEGRTSVSISDILMRCLDKPKAQWTQTDKNRVARSLQALGWQRYRERQGMQLEWRYRRVGE